MDWTHVTVNTRNSKQTHFQSWTAFFCLFLKWKTLILNTWKDKDSKKLEYEEKPMIYCRDIDWFVKLLLDL